MDRIVNHAHDELDLLLLDAQNKDAEKVSFPTEQRLKQKARAKAGHIVKKKPQVVEDHHDDCGEDFSPLGDDPYFQDEPELLTSEDEEFSLPPKNTVGFLSHTIDSNKRRERPTKEGGGRDCSLATESFSQESVGVHA